MPTPGSILSPSPADDRAPSLQQTTAVWARVYPQVSSRNGELARTVAEVSMKEGWKIEELHTEEGRLDEVFRAITLPDTVKEAAK